MDERDLEAGNEDLTLDLDALAATRGRFIARAVQSLASRRTPVFRWLPALVPVVQRLASRATPAAKRFQRVEVREHARKIAAWKDSPAAEFGPGGEPLAAGLETHLRDLMPPDASAMHVHHDSEADALARAHGADAVTIGRDVFLREDRYRPHEPEGLALLAHEATHVLEAIRPGAAWRRDTAAGVAAEEREARRREQAALAARHAPVHSPVGVTSRVAMARPPDSDQYRARATAGAATPSSPALRPMAAAADRSLDRGEPPATGAAPDFQELRRALYQDLMSQIRSELERGA